MRGLLSAAALVGAATAVPYEISDYIRMAGTTPVGSPSISNTTSPSGEPCGKLAQIQARTNSTRLPADLTLSCLKSVPLDADGALKQIDGIKVFTEFQSTQAYLKDPPPGYLYPAVDIVDGLDQIKNHLKKNEYENEYDFQLDIYDLISSAYDGHFGYEADILSTFIWERALTLVSVSSDGLSVPEIYTLSDSAQLVKSNGTKAKVSPVAKINGEDVEKWLNEYATVNGRAQDPDANYNSLFPIIPTVSRGKALDMNEGGTGDIGLSLDFQGNDTTVTYKNGTVQHAATYAFTRKSLKGVTDGKSFFKKFCSGPTKTPSNGTEPKEPSEAPYKPVPTETAFPAPPCYPKPLVLASDYSIGGYFPPDNPDLAVLSVPTFEPVRYAEFQNVVREFLATCKAQNKKKLIIDLRGNGGGDVYLGYDLFTQLFPQLTPYGTSNFRAHELFNDVGKIVSARFSNTTDDTATVDDLNDDYNTPFNYRSELNAADGNFTSWEDFYGPHTYHNDNFTSLTRGRLNDTIDTGIPVSGFGNLTHIVPVQTFKAEDIILLQDGYCASTCTVFTEFMKTQANVKQVVFGGRAQTGPMQGVGGVKGAQILYYSLIYSYIAAAVGDDATDAQQAAFAQKYPDILPAVQQAIKRAASKTAASVNVRNNIRQDDSSVTPLQFVYEAADCRLFYTPTQIFKQSAVWDAAFEAAWKDGKCVAGSTNQPSSGAKGDEQASPPKGANNFFGSNSTGPYPTDLNRPSASLSQTSTAAPTQSAASSTSAGVSPTTIPVHKNAAAVVGGSGFAAAVVGVAALVLV